MSDTPAAAPEKHEATETPQLTRPYEPHEVEPRWYAFWQEQGVFDASDDPADARPPYVVPMPPPNVTGVLHMGHAQRVTLQDGLVRYHRMRGFNDALAAGHRSRRHRHAARRRTAARA